MKKNESPKLAYQPIYCDRLPTSSAKLQSSEDPEERRRRLAPYGKMTANELIEQFIKSPEFRSEFGSDEPQSWQFALNNMYLYIFWNYPDSPLQYGEEQDAIISMFDDNAIELKMRIKEALRKGADTATATDLQATNEPEKRSAPYFTGKWADIFKVSGNTVRKWIKDKSPYHFERVGEKGRKYTLPLNEIPAEYLVEELMKAQKKRPSDK